MKRQDLVNIIYEDVIRQLYEGWYDNSTSPIHSKEDTRINLGVNPLFVDNGGHASADKVTQVSTIDYNGANFKGEQIVLSNNRFLFYKIKNFGTDTIKGTRNLFSDTKDLRRAIDTVNGAAIRNHKHLSFRFITSEDNASRKDSMMTNTFCEFSFGGDWYILTPHPVQTLRVSKFKQ